MSKRWAKVEMHCGSPADFLRQAQREWRWPGVTCDAVRWRQGFVRGFVVFGVEELWGFRAFDCEYAVQAGLSLVPSQPWLLPRCRLRCA